MSVSLRKTGGKHRAAETEHRQRHYFDWWGFHVEDSEGFSTYWVQVDAPGRGLHHTDRRANDSTASRNNYRRALRNWTATLTPSAIGAS